MKKSMYTRTALASLLTLCSFSGFAADIPGESLREIKKQESIESIKTKKVDGSVTTSEKREVMKTSNKKLKEKVDRICNVDLKKRAEELKKKEEIKLAAEQKKKAEEMKLVAEQKKKEEMKLANEKKAKLKNDKAKLKDAKAEKDKVSARNTKIEAKNGKDLKKNAKAEKDQTLKSQALKPIVNKSVESKGKINPVVSVGGVDIVDTNQGKSGLRITFGGVVDSQGYGKAGPSGDDYKRYNTMTGKSISYYDATTDKIKGADPVFYKGIGNIGDYSNDGSMVADAILHLRAENKNENLGILYGADVQFQVPVTEGKGASQGVYAARGRSAHVFINSEYGDVKLGYQFGPEALMRLDATRIATVDGGADSYWFRKVNLEGSAASFPFYVTPRLHTESFSSESEKFSFRMAGKKDIMSTLPFRVAYYSPKYMGARFGFAYSPGYDASLFSVREETPEVTNATHGASDPSKVEVKHKEDIRHVGPDYEHILSAGASYEYDLYEYKVKVKAAAVGEYGQSKQSNDDKHSYSEYVEYNNLMGINFGVNADYKVDEDQSVKFGASFAYLGKSGQPKIIKELKENKYEVLDDRNRVEGLKQFNDDGNNTMYWTAGAGYQYENIYTSLTYFGSTMNDGDKLHDIAFGVQYDLSPACSKSKFVPYAALHYFITDEKQKNAAYKIEKKGGGNVPSNQGALLLTGVKFSF